MISREGQSKGVTDGGRSTTERPAGFLGRFAKLLDQIVFCSLLVLPVLTAIPYGTVDPWWEAVFEVGVFFLTALWIIEALFLGQWRIKRLLVLLPMFVMTAYAFAQTIQLPRWLISTASSSQWLTIDRYQTHLTAVKLLALTLFTALLLIHLSSRRRLVWTVRMVIAIGLASALFGLLRQFLQSPDTRVYFVMPFLYPGVGYGQFMSANVFAFLMEMSLGLLAGLVVGGGTERKHLLVYLAGGLIIWAALVLSNSRGALLGFTCQSILLLFVGLAWWSSRRLEERSVEPSKLLNFIRSSALIRVAVIFLITATLMSGVLWMGGDRLAGKLEQKVVNAADDGTTRKEIWASTWQIIKRDPWTGIGFGAYFLAIPQYQIGSGRTRVEQAHNDYLELLASGGVIAIVLAAWFIGAVIWRARSSLRARDSYRKAAALGALAGMLSVGVHSLADFGLQITGIGVMFAMLIVIAVADVPGRSKAKLRS